MGNEEKGIQQYLSKAADEHFSIPMKGDFEGNLNKQPLPRYPYRGINHLLREGR